MARAWIEDLWLTEPKVTLPDGTATRIPVPSAAVKSLAAYMKTPGKAKVPDRPLWQGKTLEGIVVGNWT